MIPEEQRDEGEIQRQRSLVVVDGPGLTGRALVEYEKRRIGNLLLSEGKISSSGIRRVLRAQSRNAARKFGELAVRLNLVTDRDVQIALCRQYGYPSVEALERLVSPELYMALAPFCGAAELLNKILGRLLAAHPPEGLAIAIVSPESAEGRSGLAANLALAYAQAGRKTLLIDADLRKPKQHTLFGLDNFFGVTSILMGSGLGEANGEAPGIVTSTGLFGLSLIKSGPVHASPIEILTGNRFAKLLAHARATFDAVVLDTPPTQSYADAEAIATLAGHALVVTRQNRSRLGSVRSLVDSVTRRGVNVLGTILGRS